MIGNKLKLSIFGESHGRGVGLVMENFPAGVFINEDEIRKELMRRAGGRDKLSTPRLEKDEFTFLSGVFEGHTTGAPLCIFIPNTNVRSKDYDKLKYIMRPSHSDYTAYIKYNGMNDYRGGGHFSGRLTAALVVAGAIAKQYLKENGIEVGAHIYQIGGVYDSPFPLNPQFDKINKEFPVLDSQAGEKMKNEIESAKKSLDSVGGVVEAAAIGIPVGLGEPFWNSVESILSHYLFSIPAVKGVEFGAGFEIAKMYGSKANDQMYFDGGIVKTKTNHNGGICGGITNGMPVIVRAAFKPTPSIARKQSTVDMHSLKDTNIEIKGRHDPCIVHRAVPVVEATMSLALLDLLLIRECKENEFR